MMGQATSSFLKTQKEVPEDGSDAEVRGGKIRNCFPVIFCTAGTFRRQSICPQFWHRAERRPTSVRCPIIFEDRVRNRKSSGRVVEIVIGTRKKVVEEQTESAGFGDRGCSTKNQKMESGIATLVIKQSLAGWPCFLENKWGVHGVVAEDLHSVYTFESSRHPLLGV